MNNLKRYYNQNRKKIWSIVVIIAFAILLLQVANGFAKKSNEKKSQQIMEQMNNKVSTNENTNITSNENTIETANQLKSSNSLISTIEQFVEYCNQKNIESAYNMLTDDCKNEMFNDIETFERIYYNSTFENKNKKATIEKWANNTYILKFTEDALTTGKVAKTKDEQKIDYITVVKDNENYKLNINSFIGYTEISKTKTENDVTIEVLGKHTYMDYETYTLKITNNTKNNIVLDNLYNSNGIYIEDTKGITYPMYNGEINSSMVNLSSGHAKKIEIKFFSSYVSTKKIKQLVFSNITINNNHTTFIITI